MLKHGANFSKYKTMIILHNQKTTPSFSLVVKRKLLLGTKTYSIAQSVLTGLQKTEKRILPFSI